MERADIWAMFYSAALIAEREKPEEKADSMLMEFDKRWNLLKATNDQYEQKPLPTPRK